MLTRDQILQGIDNFILVAEVFAPLTPTKLDDLFLRLVKWARSDEGVLSYLPTHAPAAAGAFTAPPEALVNALRRWQEDEGITDKQLGDGKWMQLLALFMKLAELLEAFAK